MDDGPRLNAFEKRQQTSLKKQLKEIQKKIELDNASQEVNDFNETLLHLTSLHKEDVSAWDWQAIHATLPPPPPQPQRRNELRTLTLHESKICANELAESIIQSAIQKDLKEYFQSTENHKELMAEYIQLKKLASNILNGDFDAQLLVLNSVGSFEEIKRLGIALNFNAVNIRHTLSCEGIAIEVRLNIDEIVPDIIKSLTSTGKLSIKEMPKSKKYRLNHDFICSLLLRISNEVFALVPSKFISIKLINRSAFTKSMTILSASIPRYYFNEPSELIETSVVICDFKAILKGDYEAVEEPDIQGQLSPLEKIIKKARTLRQSLGSKKSINTITDGDE